MRKLLVVAVFTLLCAVSVRAADQEPSTAGPPTAGPAAAQPASEENLRKAIQLAQEAHDNQEPEAEIAQWRKAFAMATELHQVEAIYVSALGIEEGYKDGAHSSERLGALRAGVAELKKLGGAGPIWGAQLEVALAIEQEEQGKRADAAAAAKRAVAVLESALGTRSHDYRETLRTLAALFEEGSNTVSLEFSRRIEEIDKERENEPVFGFKPDSGLRAQLEQLRTAIDNASTVQVQLTLMQISSAAERLEVNNPFRAKALADAATAVIKTEKKADGGDRPLPFAEMMMRKALETRERAMGSNTLTDTSKLSLELYHLRAYQSEVDVLAAYYASAGERGKEESLLRRALGTSERILGKEHPALAGPLRRLGNLYYGAGGEDKLKQAASEAAAPPAAAGDTDSDDGGGGLDKAIALAKREVAIYEKAFGNDDPILKSSLSRLGELLWMKGDETAAKACDARAAKLRESDSDDSKTAEQTMQREVKEHRAFLRFEEAEDEYETFRKMHPDKS